MKLTWATALFLLCSSGVTSLPTESQTDLVVRGVPGDYELDNVNELEKRRGGGGGGRGGGSSGGSSGGRSGSSSGSGSSRGGSSGGSGSTSRTSNSGGTTSKGSGVTPSYGNGRYDTPNHYSDDYYGHNGGGYGWGSDHSSGYSYTKPGPKRRPGYYGKTHGMNRYYAGGATTPYRAGRSSLGITPFLLPVTALAFFPLLWYHPVYVYPYNENYNYHDDNTNKNESMPVKCLCEQYQECGCEENNNNTYYESLFNGTQPRNTSMVRVAEVNGTEAIWINGTLANGTTAADGSSAASGPMSALIYSSGYWVTAVLVAAMVWTV